MKIKEQQQTHKRSPADLFRAFGDELCTLDSKLNRGVLSCCCFVLNDLYTCVVMSERAPVQYANLLFVCFAVLSIHSFSFFVIFFLFPRHDFWDWLFFYLRCGFILSPSLCRAPYYTEKTVVISHSSIHKSQIETVIDPPQAQALNAV